jgi:hypothetical protein
MHKDLSAHAVYTFFAWFEAVDSFMFRLSYFTMSYENLHLTLCTAHPSLGSGCSFQFLNLTHTWQDSLDGGQPVLRPLPLQRTTHTEQTQIDIHA